METDRGGADRKTSASRARSVYVSRSRTPIVGCPMPIAAPMTRDYHRWFARSLSREMELLIFGHAGPPILVFPTSMGAFFEYEDRGMVAALSQKLNQGALRLF